MTKLTKLLLAITALCLTATTYINAQSPNAIPYQGVARNASGEILPTQAIGLRISLRDVTAGGTIVYQETHTPTTTALGLFNINIGTGTPGIGTLAAVNWGNGAKFIQVEMDPAGGTSYTDMGTTQLNSVPYALFAGRVPDGTYVDLTTNQTIAGSKTFTSDVTINNVKVGAGAGNSTLNDPSYQNTAIGNSTLINNSTGYANTAIGTNALTNNTTGFSNVGIGIATLNNNTSGGLNTAVGLFAMSGNSTGSSNTATGNQTLQNNTSGNANVANGEGALYLNDGSDNTGIGTHSLFNNTSGNENTAIGA